MHERQTAITGGKSRQRMQISLRLLLVGVALSSICFAWLVSTTKRQKSAKASLEKHGAYVSYEGDESLPRMRSSFASQYIAPLTSFIDIDLLLPVTEVRTRYLEAPSLKSGASYASSAVVKVLLDLPSLESASLTHADIRNEQLQSLSGLRNLKHLDLSMTRLHEGSLSPLEDLDLVTLGLSRTRVDDEGLKSLANNQP